MRRDGLEAKKVGHEGEGQSAHPIGRRAFLTAGAAALLSGCAREGGQLLGLMNGASRFNDALSARLFSSSKLAPKYAVSQRSASFPSYFISAMTPAPDQPGDW